MAAGEDSLFSRQRNMHRMVPKISALISVGILLIIVAAMNSTPGRFAYPDTDGCACFVSYTTAPSLASCNQSRPIACDYQALNKLLVALSYLDFNK